MSNITNGSSSLLSQTRLDELKNKLSLALCTNLWLFIVICVEYLELSLDS